MAQSPCWKRSKPNLRAVVYRRMRLTLPTTPDGQHDHRRTDRLAHRQGPYAGGNRRHRSRRSLRAAARLEVAQHVHGGRFQPVNADGAQMPLPW